MTYKMISTAEPDWFFVQYDLPQIAQNNPPEPIIFPVAAWALMDDGKVVGLVGPQYDKEGAHTQLCPPNPNIIGMYKHLRDFNPSQLQSLARYKPWEVRLKAEGLI